ncbi:MAG: Flp pilus assembly protein CpaB [Novosphingobium sp.]|nr:Flp pilus assembly protein CpaB [Novosphingobium sp.]
MRRDRKARLIMLAGFAAASVFVFLGVRALSGSGSDISANAQTVPVSLAQPQALLAATTRPVRIGETFTADMFRSATANPAEHPGVASTLEVLGKVAARDIGANTLISRDALTPETRLAIRVPVGMRAISIDTTDEIAVAGLIRPGDHVDVQVVYPGQDALSGGRQDGRSRASTLLQMVEVLAVGAVVVGEQTGSGPLASTPAPARTVTLALSPDQVTTLSLAKNTGALYLSLRNPDDKDFADGLWAEAPSASAAAAPIAYSAPAPRRYRAAPRATASAKPAERPIELVVGGRKSTLYPEGAAK